MSLQIRRLEHILRTISLRFQLFTSLDILSYFASIFLIVLLGGLFAQELKDISPYVPFVYYSLALACLLVVSFLGIIRIVHRLSVRSVAKGLENAFSWLSDDVTNALLLSRHDEVPSKSDQTSPSLVKAHLEKTIAQVSRIRPQSVVDFRRMISHLGLLVPLLVAFTVVMVIDPQFLSRSMALIVRPISALPVRETFISLDKVPPVVLRGTMMTITARVSGYLPERLSLKLWAEGEEPLLFDMEPGVEGRYSHRISSVKDSFRYQAVSGRARSLVHQVQVVEAPAIGKVRLSLIPPEYANLPEEVIEEGHITALKGTVVNLAALATKKVKDGRMLINLHDQLPLTVQGANLKGKFLVMYPGTYALTVTDELGIKNVDPVQYRIQLIPDKYPEGEVLSPSEDLEISGNETLPVTYTARDDFGIGEIKLIYHVGELQRFITLKDLANRRSSGMQQFDWNLKELSLTPGDRVSYRIEVWDNDTISGPKAGYSRTLVLTVRDEKDRAAKEVHQAQEISESLFNLLADQLEEVKNRKELSSEISRIMEKTDKQLDLMGMEKAERYDLEALRKNMEGLNRRMEDLPQERITQEMERLALLAEDLTKKARMHKVETLSTEMANRQRRFMDALNDLKGPLNTETLDGMLKELDRLTDLTRQVMDALRQMASRLPDEFMNHPDLKGLNFQDFFKDLEEIRKKLLSGDLRGAQEVAQRLLQALSDMMAAMARAGAQASRGAFERLQMEMAHQTSELDKILAEERSILSGTESVDQMVRSLIEEETTKRIGNLKHQLKEIMEQLRGRISSEGQDTLEEMSRMLEGGQIEKLSQLMKMIQGDDMGREEVRNLLRDMGEAIASMRPAAQEVITERESVEFPHLAGRQERNRSRTSQIAEKLEMLSQLFPGMDTEILHDMKEASRFMEGASGSLKNQDATGAIPQEVQAIQKLARSQQAMQQMAQQMAQRMQANRWGYPLVYDNSYGWNYRPWESLPTLPQPKVNQRREPGFTGIDREEFELPAKDEYKAPQMLREKVMDALKEEVPSQYRREVQRYFRELTQ